MRGKDDSLLATATGKCAPQVYIFMEMCPTRSVFNFRHFLLWADQLIGYRDIENW